MTFHHQYFQMVDLMIMHCKCAINGLNPHALPYEPEVSNNKISSEASEERKVPVEEWNTPNDYARMDNHVKTHVDIEEEKKETDMTSCMTIVQTAKNRKSIIVM